VLPSKATAIAAAMATATTEAVTVAMAMKMTIVQSYKKQETKWKLNSEKWTFLRH
jgi:Tfp pilus assembly protein FimT